jgi:hypothetical protein
MMTKKLKQAEHEAKKESDKAAEKEERWAEEQKWKLSAEEITKRVRVIRRELEAARARYEGTMFDILTEGSEPRSMSTDEGIREPYELANFLRPALEGYYERSRGPVSDEDSVAFLQYEGIEAGFQIGILAGFIFAGADVREIDRAERGLIHASMARERRVKTIGSGEEGSDVFG